jgi:hypothetical protein
MLERGARDIVSNVDRQRHEIQRGIAAGAVVVGVVQKGSGHFSWSVNALLLGSFVPLFTESVMDVAAVDLQEEGGFMLWPKNPLDVTFLTELSRPTKDPHVFFAMMLVCLMFGHRLMLSGVDIFEKLGLPEATPAARAAGGYRPLCTDSIDVLLMLVIIFRSWVENEGRNGNHGPVDGTTDTLQKILLPLMQWMHIAERGDDGRRVIIVSALKRPYAETRSRMPSDLSVGGGATACGARALCSRLMETPTSTASCRGCMRM